MLISTNMATATATIANSTSSPTPAACGSAKANFPVSDAPPSTISATGDKIQSITPKATRFAITFLKSINATASSIDTLRTAGKSVACPACNISASLPAGSSISSRSR